ncbi:Type I inositol polyphosphate 5-phosphatase 2 [Sesamum angolense]|uniref:Type I inositol polyphosphate 5-phosphatase 2 n=1 Tax=Sesamum angolense TaxID=2727404 RepID=A0AAE2BWJ4_9LAMI|nr:Type I inositol polyphosphate 5-phosphatase 2 [Sesamum angolense]
MSNGLTSSPQNIPLSGSGLKRMHRSSGNLGLIHMDQEDELEVLDSLTDELDQISGEEEDSFVEMTEMRRENALSSETVKSHPTYVRIVSKQMVGIYVSVWVRRRLRRHINNLKVSPVGVGLMGYMGNKGSVSVSMSLFQSRLCFVCSHLTSGEKYGAEQKRNSDVHEIIRRTHFSSVFDIDQPQTIPSHEIFDVLSLSSNEPKRVDTVSLSYEACGYLSIQFSSDILVWNFINMLDSEVRKLVDKKQWAELLYNDQLSKELRNGHVFDGWKEGIINFAPTYKYEINSDRYVGENPREGEKKEISSMVSDVLMN